MVISIINHSGGEVLDADVQRVVRAVNRQIEGDFAPYWSLGATLRLEGRSEKSPSKQTLADMRGDAVLYLWNRADADDALGYHDLNNRGIPYGFVFTDVAKELGEHWSVTLSHEALELIGDPEANLLVMGPHPRDPGRDVFHWYEMCDAVQDETYEIDGVAVSNFVLPLYFTGGNELGGRNDFLGTSHAAGTLRSFEVNPGGYVGFFDPKHGRMDTHEADNRAVRRQRIKSQVGSARRGMRYRRYHTGTPRTQPVLRAVGKVAR
jgi:hypothetical protein